MIFMPKPINVLKLSGLLILAILVTVSGRTGLAADLKFNMAPRFEIGFNTTRSTVADFDGDGFKDTVSINNGDIDEGVAAEIRILFGNGDGFGDALILPSFYGTFPVAAGDLNNDGKIDFVTAGWTYNAIGVHFNLGNRQFAPPVYSFPQLLSDPAAVNGQFFGLEIADFDGDGNNDIVALQGQTKQFLRFFRFNLSGTLSEFAWTRQFQNDASYHAEISVGDVNNDNRPDLVFFSGNTGNRRLDFVFGQPPGGVLNLSYGLDLSDQAVGISIRDLDNDGDKDMAIAFLDTTTPTRHYLRIFRNNGSGGFTPLPEIFLEYPFPPDDITTADFTGDGKPDIAALISSSIVMTLNGAGDCSFSGEKFYSISPSNAIFSADLNQDGKQDILTQQNVTLVNNYVSVLLNNRSLGLKAPQVTLWAGSFIDAADFNNDGYKDLASAWLTYFNSTSTIDLLINDRTGGLTNEEDNYATPHALNEMKTGDFNGDGKSDVISIHDDNSRVLAVYPGGGNGTISAAVTTQLNRGLLNVVVGNFNSDGKDDVFVIDDSAKGYAMLANGNGTFSAAAGSPVTLPENVPFELQKGDFNRDNKIDLIISMNSEVKLWLGDGTGRFTQSSAVIAPMEDAVPGDFNGDGNLDLAGTTSTGISGVLGDGSGGFGAPFSRPIAGIYATASGGSTVAADFDLDGFDDVAMVMPDNSIGNLIIVPAAGAAPAWGQPIYYGLGTARKLIAADFNGDQKPDLGYLGGNVRGIIYNTNGAARNNGIFDFDGDGKTDISIFRPTAGEWWYQRSSNNSNYAAQFGASTDKLTPADFTGDGKTDIAIFRPLSGEWFVLRSEDGSFYSFPYGTSGDIPFVGDFDMDGKADSGVFRPSSATWFIRRSSDGGSIIEQFGQTGDVPVVADYDGDGKSDIAIYRVAQGEWWINRSAAGLIAFQFGNSNDKPVQGDFTGDGKADVALFRPVTGEWFVLRSENQSYYSFPFGTNGDIPAPGDYDGDGKIDATVFRPSSNTWFVNKSTGGNLIQTFGQSGDVPVPNAFVP